MSSRKNPRDTARWQRIRATIGPCSTEIDPDEHADHVYDTVMGRSRWNVEEELAAELADTRQADRARSNGRYSNKPKRAHP